MLSPDDLTKITDHGTCLDGEGVYYVSDSRPGHWRLTLRGVSFYKHALQHFGLEWPLLTVLSDEQLWALSRQLLRARTIELGLELAQELENGKVPARERLLAKAVLHDNLQQALRAAEHHCTTARQGPNIVPGPFGAPPLAVGPHQDFVDGSNWGYLSPQ
jgi:hypothetical protein